MVLFILLVVSQSVFSVHFCLLIYFYPEGFALYMGSMGSLGNWGLCPIYQGATNLWGYMLNSTIWVWVPFLFFFFFFSSFSLFCCCCCCRDVLEKSLVRWIIFEGNLKLIQNYDVFLYGILFQVRPNWSNNFQNCGNLAKILYI